VTRFALIVNPAAGRGRARSRVRPAVTALTETGADAQVRESASLEHARQVAAAAAAAGDIVVAVGGDGLASALAGVAAAAGACYGIVPAGRGNDLARMLRIPTEPAAAGRLLATRTTRRIDLIGVSVPGQPEVIVAGTVYAGVPALAGQIANASRWLAGPVVYPVAALRALARWQPARFQLATGAPGYDFTGYAVVIANSAYFGAGMLVAPSALIDDGVLDLVLMRDGPKLAFVRALASIRRGGHTALAQVTLARRTDVTLTLDRPVPVAADGELLPFAAPLAAGRPLRVRVLPDALSVIAPVAGTAR